MNSYIQEEGYLEVIGGNIWYEKVGDSDKTPLIVLHGGPGFSIDSMRVLAQLANERPIILYDQLGAGKSDRPTDQSLWHIDRFVHELALLIQHLQFETVHLLGHSWGTMLAANYLLKNDQKVKSVIFSSPCLQAERWNKDQLEYRKLLPEHIQHILNKCEAEGRTDSNEYMEAIMEVYQRHVCRLKPWPEVLQHSANHSNHDIYRIMWGENECKITGNLKDYDITPYLHNIKIPVLFLCGQYDEATPETTKYYSEHIAGATVHVFENSSHMPFLEQPEEYVHIVRRFLQNSDMVMTEKQLSQNL